MKTYLDAFWEWVVWRCKEDDRIFWEAYMKYLKMLEESEDKACERN